MEIICNRSVELQRENRLLPAEIYNTALVLLDRGSQGVLFVPIRSMQYLAIMDHEEIIFLDSENKIWVEIAWQNFHPQQRDSLNTPVPYQAVYYTQAAKETMKRLQGEFAASLMILAGKNAPSTIAASIIKLNSRKPVVKS